ncbi:MAG: hypothetical protein NXH97_13415 [Rhodobacteraceae bacterium]|nr:hypothetical protein [Paracoccaceae bacterium]
MLRLLGWDWRKVKPVVVTGFRSQGTHFAEVMGRIGLAPQSQSRWPQHYGGTSRDQMKGV